MSSGFKNVKITQTDHGFKALQKNLETSQTATVKVGIQGSDAEADHDGITNVELGSFHEFGTARAPERSFIRATVDINETEIHKLQQRLGALITARKVTTHGALEILGLKMQGLIIERIRSKIPPELSAQTIRRKGSSTPLIDSGQLVQAITYKVEK